MKQTVVSESVKTSKLPALAEVFEYPEYTIRGIKTWEQVAILGRENLSQLIKKARQNEQRLSRRIKELTEQMEIMKGKSGAWFVEAAKGFLNPQDMVKGDHPRGDSWDIEPIDEKSQTRAFGTTTFNICGWCKHANCGTMRMYYYITTNCGLYPYGEECKFDTPCKLQKLTEEDFRAVIRNLKRKISFLKDDRKKVQTGIRQFQLLAKDAPSKPYLMSLRPEDYYKIGDELIINLRAFKDKKFDAKWVQATCIFGYRHQDGFVSAVAPFPVHDNLDYYGGRGISSSESNPGCLQYADYHSLRTAFLGGADQEFVFLWLDNIDSKKIDLLEFRKDLMEGWILRPPEDQQPIVDEMKVESVKDALRVLQMLMEPESIEDLERWVKMQLRYIRPAAKRQKADDPVKEYVIKQTRAVYAARKLLKERLEDRRGCKKD